MLKLCFKNNFEGFREASKFGYKEGEEVKYISTEYDENDGTFILIWDKHMCEWNWISVYYLKPLDEPCNEESDIL